MECANIGSVRAAGDSATLISLAWAGQLGLLSRAPIELVIPAKVRQEAVVDGLDRGYPDAAAIELAIKEFPTTEPAAAQSVDDAVLQAGRAHGALLTDDLALGRRAANLGARWLRTGDLVVLCVRTARLDTEGAAAALRALHSAGRLTHDLFNAYLKDLS